MPPSPEPPGCYIGYSLCREASVGAFTRIRAQKRAALSQPPFTSKGFTPVPSSELEEPHPGPQHQDEPLGYTWDLTVWGHMLCDPGGGNMDRLWGRQEAWSPARSTLTLGDLGKASLVSSHVLPPRPPQGSAHAQSWGLCLLHLPVPVSDLALSQLEFQLIAGDSHVRSPPWPLLKHPLPLPPACIVSTWIQQHLRLQAL